MRLGADLLEAKSSGSEFRTRSRLEDSVRQKCSPLVTNWAKWTKLWERGGCGCKIWSLMTPLPDSVLFIQFNPGEGPQSCCTLGAQLPVPTGPGSPGPRNCPEQTSAKASSSPQARPAGPSPTLPTPSGLACAVLGLRPHKWTLWVGPARKFQPVIPAWQRGLEPLSDTSTYP